MSVNNINLDKYPHIVIVGGGFAGLTLAKRLRKKRFRVTLIDKNNYHQFAPLFYQVAAAQLEPSAILFPLRKEIRPYPRNKFLMADVLDVDPENKTLKTSVGDISYDYLVLSAGTDSNFFGMEGVRQNAFGLKSVSEALALRNHLLQLLEQASCCKNTEEYRTTLNIAVVGGGPTGVEIAGAIGEMKRYILKRDYPAIKSEDLRIILVEGQPRLLAAMSEKSGKRAQRYLTQLGVELMLGKSVSDYDGKTLKLADGQTIDTYTVIWGSGVTGGRVQGLDESLYQKGNRLKVDEHNRLEGNSSIFILGDIALQTEAKYPKGHPQVAPVAVQQAKLLSKNLVRMQKEKPLKPFRYRNKGAMAIVGRNRAVADIGKMHFGGFIAWLMWLFIHLLSIIGFKNKLFVVIDWAFSYFSHDASLRLIIRPKNKNK